MLLVAFGLAACSAYDLANDQNATGDEDNALKAAARGEQVDSAQLRPKRVLPSPGILARYHASLGPDGEGLEIGAGDLARAASSSDELPPWLVGRHIVVRGKVRRVEVEDDMAFVTLGTPGQRGVVDTAAPLDDQDEDQHARALPVGKLIAVGCGDVSTGGADQAPLLRDCVGFDS